jgi:uncharacterized RDD family membrane protein YckC
VKAKAHLVTIETPEHVELQFLLAGLGTRSIAWIIDTAIQIAAIVLLTIALTLILILFDLSLDAADYLSGVVSKARPWLTAVYILMFGLLLDGYFMLFEYFWSGSTPGKKAMCIRVIRKDGRPLSFFDAVIRNVLRFVDLLAFCYPIGLAVMFLDSQNRRLGDFAAGTLVILEEEARAPVVRETPESVDRFDAELAPVVAGMSRDDYRLLSRFLARRDELDDEYRDELARQLYGRMFKAGSFPEEPLAELERSLERVENLYRERTRIL